MDMNGAHGDILLNDFSSRTAITCNYCLMANIIAFSTVAGVGSIAHFRDLCPFCQVVTMEM